MCLNAGLMHASAAAHLEAPDLFHRLPARLRRAIPPVRLHRHGWERRLRGLWLALLLGSGASWAVAAQLAGDVLVLVPLTALVPFAQGFTLALSEGLAQSAPDVRLHLEALPLDLDAEQSERWFTQRLAGRSFDLMLVVSPTSLRPALRARAQRWPGVPVVLVVGCDDAPWSPSDRAITQVCVSDTTAPTLKLAMALLPQTQHIALVGSPAGHDPFRSGLPRTLAAYRGQVDVIDLGGQSVDQLRQSVQRLPPHTVVFLGGPNTDAAGHWIYPRRLLDELKPLCTAPLFSDLAWLFGRGVMGGALIDADLLGRTAAEVVVRRLRGEAVPAVQAMATPLRVDWRELQRQGLSEAVVPAGVALVFREVSVWERYRWQLMLTGWVVVAQSVLVLWLVLERRRRRRAELQAHRRLSELAHLNRLGTVSQLSLSLAHEINQPLGTILSSAQTCEVLLDQPQPPLHELRALLARIVQADALASRIVRNLRGLVDGRKPERARIEVDLWVRDTATLLAPDVALRGVQCVLELHAPGLCVLGDRAQLQQVLINLVLNALEAMQAPDAVGRRLGLSTRRLGPEQLCLCIDDGGPGLPAEAPESVFAPFYSTKPQGLGLGLGIARELVQAHGGELRAHNRPGGGARFELTLPLAPGDRQEPRA